jgi:hypothetical protein
LRYLTSFVAALATVALLAFGFSPSATAATGHEYERSFGPDCTSATKFQEPGGVAVDEVDQQVYVADQMPGIESVFRCTTSGAEAPFSAGPDAGTNKLEGFQFSATQGASQIAVSPVSHAFFVTGGFSPVKAYEESGEPLIFSAGPGQGTNELHAGEAAGVAVDAHGDIYVGENTDGISPGFVRIFAPDGEELTSFVTSNPRSLAVDSFGNLYVDHLGTRSVEKFSPSTFPVTPSTTYTGTRADAGPDISAAIDPSNDDLYVLRITSVESEYRIFQYDSQGREIGAFPAAGEPGELFAPQQLSAEGLTVDGSTGEVYTGLFALDENFNISHNAVNVYGPAPNDPPSVGESSTANVTTGSVQLQAQINANHFNTRYSFQYLSRSAYLAGGESFVGAASTPVASLGASGVFRTGEANVSGLTPDTAYVFRVGAENVNNEGAPEFSTVALGSESEFRTFPAEAASPALPDGRAYELVSPSEKASEVYPPDPYQRLNGSCERAGAPSEECYPGLLGQLMPMQASADGNAVTYVGGPFHPGLSSEASEYLSRRSASGWDTEALSGPLFKSSGQGQGYRAVSPDLSRSIQYQVTPPLTPDAPAVGGVGFANLYLRKADGTLQPLVEKAPPHRDPGERVPGGNQFAATFSGGNAGTGSVPAYTHLAFAANDALTPEVPGVAPAAPEVSAQEEDLYEWADGGLHLINVLPNGAADPGATIGSGRLLAIRENEIANFDHAISNDGSRIFWSDLPSGQVYVRIDGTETREINSPGDFLTAAADGSKVLLSNGCLYDVARGDCEDLTDGQGGFSGLVGASEDLSRVYFVDTEALSGSSENANHETPQSGEDNLYAWHAGTVTFIGILQFSDNKEGRLGQYGVWKPSAADRLAQVTSDGRYLAFQSVSRLTAYNNEINKEGVCRLELCPEVYEYDAVKNELSCASCNPTGARPKGKSSLSLIYSREEPFPGFPQPRNLSPQGEGRLFFNSGDHLSPRDNNGRVVDVYEWEPSGVGSCERAAGCISLISGGSSTDDSAFVDSTPTGSDAFFITRQKLVPSDANEQLDLYDARMDGGFPEGTGGSCSAEACKGEVAGAPAQPSAASNAVSGTGNVKSHPSRCHGKGKAGNSKKCKKQKKPHHKGKAKKRQHGRSNSARHRLARRSADRYDQGGSK